MFLFESLIFTSNPAVGILVLGARLVTVFLNCVFKTWYLEGAQRDGCSRTNWVGQTGFLRLNCVGGGRLLVDHGARESFRGAGKGPRNIRKESHPAIVQKSDIERQLVLDEDRKETDRPDIVPDEKS